MSIVPLSRVWINPYAKPIFENAMKETLKVTGRIFANEAYNLTSDEGHVVTGRYRVSIGNEHSEDGIFNFVKDNELDVGTNVFYAVKLENWYSILARATDKLPAKAKDLVAGTFAEMLKYDR